MAALALRAASAAAVFCAFDGEGADFGRRAAGARGGAPGDAEGLAFAFAFGVAFFGVVALGAIGGVVALGAFFAFALVAFGEAAALGARALGAILSCLKEQVAAVVAASVGEASTK